MKKEISTGKTINDSLSLSNDENLMQLSQESIKERELDLSQKGSALAKRETDLRQREEDVSAKEEALSQREQQVVTLEIEAKNNFPNIFKEKFQIVENQFKARETELSKRHQSLEQQAERLRMREQKISEAENIRDEGFTQIRKAIDDELSQKRRSFDEELLILRQKRFKELENDIEKERIQRLAILEHEVYDERERCAVEIKKRKNEFDKFMKEAEDQLNQRNKQLIKQKEELDSKDDDIAYEQLRLETRENKLKERSQNIDEEIENRLSERLKSFESEEKRLKKECARLREAVRISEETFGIFEELKRKLGNSDPEQVLLKLNTQEEELKRLRAELLDRPTEEMRMNYDAMLSENQKLKDSCTRLQEDCITLRQKIVDQNQYDLKISELESDNKSLRNRNESLDREYNFVQSELKRIQASYEREQDREARIRDIETPYFTKELSRSMEKTVNEMDWLNCIYTDCIDYGLRFPKRILHAFHTALKTAEWSPLTVLAGVSGTGKSELPRLYSHFGGMKFFNLAVQPNWDSQESMLGFFNSIDNKFDAQPILKLLAQSQKKAGNDYPGIEDVMSLILLDEMNLAHVELYFAEFLSKLELRRGRKGIDVPSLEVKLGAGIQPYDLPLGRNVLWTGTMNQDETTKSLSDKVLDRGIVIHFPRPTTFERRIKLKTLNNSAPLLSRKVWESWWNRESKFTDEQITPFKSFVEEMNKSLANVGRALGHRVWQSIEYYMGNYPGVILAQKNADDSDLSKTMKIAFEDQLVQKVMPKLRGIETRGRGKSECLDKIRNQLVNDDYAIVEDFDLACEFGYGQFMWHSANYLKEDVTGDSPEKSKPQGNNSSLDIFLNEGVELELAKKLANAGFQSIDDIRRAKDSDFLNTGMNESDILEISKKVNSRDV